MKAQRKSERPLLDLIDLIQFTEQVTAKIHGLHDEKKILRAVASSFTRKEGYTVAIFKLARDGSFLTVAETSLSSIIVRELEKILGTKLRGFKISLKDSEILRQVAADGRTVQARGADIISSLLPPRMAARINKKITALGDEPSVLTPLFRNGKLIGVLSLTSTCLEDADHIVPSIKNLASHISLALEAAASDVKRQKAEAALAQSETYFRQLIEYAPDMIIVLNADATIRYTSPSLERIAGYESGELIGKIAFDFVHPDDVTEAARLFDEGLHTPGFTASTEIRLCRKDGTWRFVDLVGRNLLEDPVIKGIVLNFQDIHERKQAQELFTTLATNSPIGAYIVQDGVFQFVNPAFKQDLGYSPEELLGTPPLDLVHPEDRSRVRREAARMLKGDTSAGYQMRGVAKDGSIRYFYEKVIGIEYGGKPATLGSYMDITEATQKLRESEERFRTLIEYAGTPITYLDYDGKILLINGIGAANLGGIPEDFIGESIYAVMPDMAELIMSRVREVFYFGEEQEYEDAVELPTGTQWFVSTMHPVKGADNNIFGVQIISQDITERKRAEERVWHTNAVLRTVRAVNDQLIREDSHDKLIRNACRILIEAGVYLSSWAILFDDFGRLTGVTGEGLGDLLPNFIAQVEVNNLPRCTRIPEENSGFLICSAGLECAGCSLGPVCETRTVITLSLEHGDNQYGWISVTCQTLHQLPEEEKAFLGELASNIAFSLYELNLEDERRRAEEVLRDSEDRFRTIFENAHDEIIYLDQDGTVIDVNNKVQDIFGYTREEVVGRKFTEFATILPDYILPMEEMFAEAMEGSGGGGLAEFETKRKDGSHVFVEASVSPIKRKNRIEGILVIVRDITARKEMQERINRYSTQLEQNLSELQEAYQKLKELDQMKDNFLSTVSHELRTPLTSIKSFAEILLTYENDAETQREFLNIINDESDRLTRLINDFLDLTKIEAGHVVWETDMVNMGEIIESAISVSEGMVKKMNLKLESKIESGLVPVCGDRDRFIQVLTNLISNATKFSPESGIINVHAEAIMNEKDPEEPVQIKVSVVDHGKGIAPQDQETIFQKFTQIGDTLRDKPPGTGLGLAICREIITHYGGSIWVESELGQGSKFSFILPAASDTGKLAQSEAEPTAESAEIEPRQLVQKDKDTVLVVDDEVNFRRFLTHELDLSGYNVVQASTGSEALERARGAQPDLITLDLMLPDIGGLEVLTLLKNDPSTRDIPVLIISIMEDKSEALRMGAVDFVTKPCSGEVVLGKVRKLIQSSAGNIMIVDDDDLLVKSITYEMKRRGLSTRVTKNASDALESALRNPPDLIILDIMIPQTDGHELIRELKQHPETAKVPIIVLTGMEVDGHRNKALALGATEYMLKSTGLESVVECCTRILQETGSRV